ncbi:response regulator transcription factor [Parabacteroides johnsonii]|uniref:response regulator transcription factor n=1 Tax=Parabacteroides johnsonii TaxID=387661 RepID=UPI0024305404|nr:response regulator transcription factor [Parabacteroides johnsonii]
MTNNKLIYIEDDQILGNMITQALAENGFEVDFRTTLNGLQDSLASLLPDLLILDIKVNNQNCLDILPAIRSQYPQLPVIIASSHTDGTEIIRSYDTGANHYIKKPYDITELIFQIRKLLQQPEKQTVAMWTIDTYQVDTTKHLLICPDKKIEKLSPKEFLVLQKLYSNKKQVVTRKQLLEEIWRNDLSEESLNNIISQLRKKFTQDKCISIQTYPCIGYQLDF